MLQVYGSRRLRCRPALIVEDERAIRDLLELHLASAGFAVETAADGSTALRLLQERPFELVVLDVMLPGVDGVSISPARPRRRPERDGGDPHGDGPRHRGRQGPRPRERRRRLHRQALRRPRAAGAGDRGDAPARARVEDAAGDGPVLTRGALHIDTDRRAVLARGEPIELTRQEFDVLHHLAARPGRVFSREALLEAVWADDVYVTDRTVDTVISRLRRKVEQDPRDPELILTAWGVGYKFADGDRLDRPTRPGVDRRWRAAASR